MNITASIFLLIAEKQAGFRNLYFELKSALEIFSRSRKQCLYTVLPAEKIAGGSNYNLKRPEPAGLRKFQLGYGH